MAGPLFNASPGVYTLVWESEQVLMRLDRIHESHGVVNAEIRVETTVPGGPNHLHHTRINLLSTRARADVAKQLNDRLNTCDWVAMMEVATVLTLDAYRTGEPMQVLHSSMEIKPPEYLIWPIIPKNQPTILFGDGAAGKSTLALLLSMCLLNGWDDNPFNLKAPSSPGNVLYLDWETDHNVVLWTLKRLQIGLNQPECALHYKRCSRSLTDELPEIQKMISDIQPIMMVVDSIGPAVSTDLNANEGATALLGRDLRGLNITTLCLGHTSKSEQGKKTVFGSAFYQNLARSVWEVRKHQEAEDEKLEVGVFCKKANLSRLFKPVGFHFSFIDDEAIIVEKQQVKDVPELAKSLPLQEQIAYVLQHGIMNTSDIASELENTTEGTVKATCNRYKDRFIRFQDGWGLKANVS